MSKVGVIGVGAMGGALTSVICDSVDPKEVAVFDVSAERAAQMADKTGCAVVASAEDVVKDAEIILLAVKPQAVDPVMAGLLPIMKANADAGKKQILLSIAAGWTIEQLDKMLADAGLPDMPAIRAMPNIPVRVKQGVILFTGDHNADKATMESVMALFKSGGMCVECEEELMVTSCAVFSCSPAMVYMFIESIADAGVQIGMERGQATRFAAQAVMGSAAMVLDGSKHIGQLKEELDTPGGMTIGGTNLMEQMGFRGSVIAGVIRAHERQFGLN